MKHWRKFITAVVLVIVSSVVFAGAADLTRMEDGTYRRIEEMEKAVPAPMALAEGTGITVIQEGVRYELNDGEASVVGYTGKIDKDCRIPEQITVNEVSCPVTAIAANGFLNCSALTSVVIPETVTIIGDNAFAGCTALTEVTIPAEVSLLGNTVFRNCKALQAITVEEGNEAYYSVDGVLFDAEYVLLQYPIGKETAAYRAPAGTAKIGEYAFYYAEALENVILPDSVTEIGESAFSECRNLTSIDFGNGLETIGYDAFWHCQLGEVNLPAAMEKLANAFEETTGVQAYNVAEGCERFFSQNGVLFENGEAGDVILRYYPDGRQDEQYTVPENVSVIGEFAFGDCWSLSEITLPETLAKIQFGAFTCCGVTQIVIPDSVTELAACAFQCCDQLQSVDLGSGVTHLEWNTFYSCEKLEEILIPAQVTEIDDGTFESCTSLRKITVSQDNGWFSSADGVLYDKDRTTLLAYPGGKTDEAFTISKDVTAIAYGALSDCRYLRELIVEEGNQVFYTDSGVLFEKGTGGDVLHTFLATKEEAQYRVPEGVTGIALNAFARNQTIMSVDTNGVEKIGESAFQDSSLSEIMLGPVTEIERNAFLGTQIESITFPDTVTTVGNQVIDFCDDLEYVVFQGSTPPEIGSLSLYGNDVRYIYVPEGTQVAYKDALAGKCNAGAMIVEGDYVPEAAVQDKIKALTEGSTLDEINDAAAGVVRLTKADAAALPDEALLKVDELFQTVQKDLTVVITDDQAGTDVDVKGAAVASGLVESQDETGAVSGTVEITAVKQESVNDAELLRLDFTMYVNEEERELQAPVIVSVRLPEAMQDKEFTILHYLNDWQTEEIDYTLKGDVCTFRAPSFSSYVFENKEAITDSQIRYETNGEATLFLAGYTAEGQMVTVEEWSVTGTGTENFQADPSLTYKAFLLDGEMKPAGMAEVSVP